MSARSRCASAIQMVFVLTDVLPTCSVIIEKVIDLQLQLLICLFLLMYFEALLLGTYMFMSSWRINPFIIT